MQVLNNYIDKDMRSEDDFPLTCISFFNWRFWKPVKCLGGDVYLGLYYIDSYGSFHNEHQMIVKSGMGLLR